MNAISKIHQSNQDIVSVLHNTLYPGARPESVAMVLGYCQARGLDPMLKPVHIVPMWVKDAVTGQGSMRDVVLPGIALYRIQASRTGTYAGKDEPVFGPDITRKVGNMEVTFPQWCKVTVRRLVNGQEKSWTAKEFWLENYATAGKDKTTGKEKEEPNAMWRRRAYGQLAKVAESQALRMAFPEETGSEPTAEEMEGKGQQPPDDFRGTTIDAAPVRQEPPRQQPQQRRAPDPVPAAAPRIDDEIPDFDMPQPDPKVELANKIVSEFDAANTMAEFQEITARYQGTKLPKHLSDLVMTARNAAKHGLETQVEASLG